jgi:AcrR family transcriptional regulator
MVKEQSQKKNKQVDSTLTRRDKIIQVAARIFAEKGYHGTTLDEIASELVITKPALYYHIKSKEDLLREIINSIVEPLETISRVKELDLSPREKLQKIITLLVISGAERQDTTTILFQDISILPKRKRDAIRRREKEIERCIQEILREGIEKGDFTVDDVKIASYGILGAANWTYRWYSPDGMLTPEQIAEKIVRLLENGYLKRP